MKNLHCLFAALALACGASIGHAQTTVSEGWVRGTVPNQSSSGAYMKIQSARGGKLVSAQSPLAGVTEVHEMAMEGDVMKMRAITALDLPAGKAVELKPGGYHVMLMELKQTLKEGDKVPLNLVVEGKDGKRETLELQLPVKGLGTKPTEHTH